MKNLIFVFCFLGLASSCLSQVPASPVLDTTYVSFRDKYTWSFYQDLQMYTSVNQADFFEEETLFYQNVLDTLRNKERYIYLSGILEIEKWKEDQNRVTIVFITTGGEVFFIHFVRDYQDLFFVKEKIFIKMVITDETNEAGQHLTYFSEFPVVWLQTDPDPYDIIERVRTKFF